MTITPGRSAPKPGRRRNAACARPPNIRGKAARYIVPAKGGEIDDVRVKRRDGARSANGRLRERDEDSESSRRRRLKSDWSAATRRRSIGEKDDQFKIAARAGQRELRSTPAKFSFAVITTPRKDYEQLACSMRRASRRRPPEQAMKNES